MSTTNVSSRNYSKFSNENLSRRIDSQISYASSTSIRDDVCTGFHNLPTRVLLEIFCHLDESALRKNVIPVCHKWRLVASLPELWHKIKFKGSHIPHNFICKQLRMFKHLKKVHLSHMDDVVPIIRQLSRCSPCLTHAAITYCKSTENYDSRLSEKVLRNLILSCRHLEEVNLKGTQFYGNSFYVELASLPNLKSVTLSDNKYCSSKNLFQLVLNANKLEELKLSHRNIKYNLSDDEVVFLFTHLRNLKSLSFDMIGLTDSSLQSILQCKQLEKLCLLNCTNVSNEALAEIGTLKNLTQLKVCHSPVDATSLQTFCTTSPRRNLKYLNLTGSWKLTSTGLKSISECCKNLDKIVLKSCKNVDSIEPLLRNCNNITTLNVAFCENLTTNNFTCIPVLLGNLEVIYVDNGRRQVAEQLKQSLPQLRVYLCESEYNKNVQFLQ